MVGTRPTPPTANQVEQILDAAGVGHFTAHPVLHAGEQVATIYLATLADEDLDQLTPTQRQMLWADRPPPQRPSQYGGSQDYHCDLGEAALGIWYIGGSGPILIDWHYRPLPLAPIEVERNELDARPGRAYSWFVPTSFLQRVLRTVWSFEPPGWLVTGTCV
jgi:hypothetical protein